MADDLVESRVDETVELDLRDRMEALERQADRDAHDARLGERRIEDALLAEFFLESVCDPKDAAQASHVFSEDQHPVVFLHRIPQPGGDRPAEGHAAHRAGSREAEKASRSSSKS